MMTKVYKNPPLEEALVEFQFAASQEWDLTIPGKFHERPAIKNAYPGKPRQQKLLQATFQGVQGQPPGVAVQEGLSRVQLVDADARRLVALGPGVLSVHVLRPYDGWAQFRPRIEAAMRAYAEVAGVSEVVRIGVRYINKIVVSEPAIKLTEYFLCSPPVPEGLPENLSGFMSRVHHSYPDGVALFVTFASLEGQLNTSAFLVDIDVVWASPEAVDVDKALSLVDDLHEREGKTFEHLITDRTRGLFNA